MVLRGRLSGVLLLTVVLAGQTPAPTATIEGRVTGQDGAPLAGVTVRLVKEGTPLFRVKDGVRTEMSTASTVTGADGAFVVEGLEPAGYTLHAQHSGYVLWAYGSSSEAGRLFPLRAGQLMRVDIRMKAEGRIRGTVLDENGHPLENVMVTAYRWQYPDGRAQLRAGAPIAVTKSGDFQLSGMAPGKYTLAAEFHSPSVAEAGGRDASANQEYVTTYFPDSIDAATAGAVFLSAGTELRNLDIHMRRERVFRVRGKTVDAVTGEPVSAWVSIHPTDRFSGAMSLNSRVQAFGGGRDLKEQRRSDGSFELPGLLPGSYQIRGDGFGPNARSAVANVTVTDENIDGFRLLFRPQSELRGRFRFEGTPPKNRTAPRILLGPADTSGRLAYQPPRVLYQSDGGFRITGVSPDIYRLVLASPGAYIVGLRLNGVAAPPSKIDLTSAAAGELEVVLSAEVASVSGIAHDSNGEPQSSVTVSLWSDDSEVARTTNTDENGGFRFDDLPPGRYHAAAWEDADLAIVLAPEFRNRFPNATESLLLNPGANRSANLTVIPRRTSEAAATKFR